MRATDVAIPLAWDGAGPLVLVFLGVLLVAHALKHKALSKLVQIGCAAKEMSMSALVPLSEPFALTTHRDEIALQSWDYTKRALASPVNLALFGATLSMAVALNSAVLLSIAVIAQCLIVLGIARLRWFRDLIDRDVEAERDAVRARRIESVLIQISARHREAYEKVSRLVDRMEMEDRDVAAGLELRILLDRYLELALSHRRCQSAVAATDRRSLERQLEILCQTDPRTSAPRMRQLIKRRVEIIRSRIEVHDTDQERLYALEHELATIADLVELAHQKWTSRAVVHLADPDIERCLANLEAAEAALLEVNAAADASRLSAESTSNPCCPPPHVNARGKAAAA